MTRITGGVIGTTFTATAGYWAAGVSPTGQFVQATAFMNVLAEDTDYLRLTLYSKTSMTAAALLSPRAATVLRSFLRRSASDKTMEAMGYVAGIDADGFRYKRTW